MFNNIISISTLSVILSLINSLLTVVFVYKYKSTNDTKWLKHITLIMLTYNILDLILEIKLGVSERITFIVHHLVSIICNAWARINCYGISILPEIVYTLLVTESSTIFLNINKLIKLYLENNTSTSASLTNILKNVTSINYVFFLPLFVYFRIYKTFNNGVFNPNFYATLLSNRDDIWHYVNRVILLCLTAFSVLNIYWLILICKATFKKFSHLFKSKTDKDIKKNEGKKDKNTDFENFVKEVEVDEKEDNNEASIKEDIVNTEVVKETSEQPEVVKENVVNTELVKETSDKLDEVKE